MCDTYGPTPCEMNTPFLWHNRRTNKQPVWRHKPTLSEVKWLVLSNIDLVRPPARVLSFEDALVWKRHSDSAVTVITMTFASLVQTVMWDSLITHLQQFVLLVTLYPFICVNRKGKHHKIGTANVTFYTKNLALSQQEGRGEAIMWWLLHLF